jgi:hypothetical protein
MFLRTRPPSCLIISLTVLVTLPATTPAWAWARLGYRVISRLAEQHLTPAARAGIAGLLEADESLADSSTWADEVRGRMRHAAPWHYVDVPLDESKYDAALSANDSKHGCVVDKINEFRKLVSDKSKSIEDRRFALRFLVHCLQDMHQACHVGENHDKGGNDTGPIRRSCKLSTSPPERPGFTLGSPRAGVSATPIYTRASTATTAVRLRSMSKPRQSHQLPRVST